GKVIYDVWKMGGRFDAWSDYMDYDRWMAAFGKNDLDATQFNQRAREIDEFLPWDHVDVGVTKNFLVREYERAARAEVTPNCRAQCSGCGVATYKRGICVD
ncbi:MAG: B12-binding domain-containing radical SAM protein, partial [Clostridia bacterium]|nr:B12-binding domain-containing radical SAM protein [Clostridia bacterium]